MSADDPTTSERTHAEQLYAALENMLGDWYLFNLAEITRDDICEGSAHDAMKILKRFQHYYRADDLRHVAIACRPKSSTK